MDTIFRTKRQRRGGDIACIFVHAGAGYHSLGNEETHLRACADAARAAMAILQAGGCAVDAVELAVKVLEDREITNAGYGSNLAMDGVVECDAVVVDHYGRSGGAGAVAQIKNPISLARLLLDRTTQQLTLRRVPPNLLIGQGATDFAWEHNMTIVPHDRIISPAARERWQRWNTDLARADADKRREDAAKYGLSPARSEPEVPGYEDDGTDSELVRRNHTKSMKAYMWAEGKPLSPPPSDSFKAAPEQSSPPSYRSAADTTSTGSSHGTDTDYGMDEYTDPDGPPGMLASSSKNPFANSTQQGLNTLADMSDGDTQAGFAYNFETDDEAMDHSDSAHSEADADDYSVRTGAPADDHIHAWHDDSESDSDGTANEFGSRSYLGRDHSTSEDAARQLQTEALGKALPETSVDQDMRSPSPSASTALGQIHKAPLLPPGSVPLYDGAQVDEDIITDTVGAIAIDMYGNIACGASSGGIGMKHRGRIGPAALVGIGAAVIPVDNSDPDRMTVASVTSGTGEHMGTTQAAGVVSERIYQNVRRVPGGAYEEANDDEAMRGFIERDFMGHPSVVHSHSTGAIGVLTVKKTREGVYLYFGHNTDSFALASMHSEENKPVCTMSRSRGGGVVAQGGRAMRYVKKKK